jgi:hypothetical protein
MEKVKKSTEELIDEFYYSTKRVIEEKRLEGNFPIEITKIVLKTTAKNLNFKDVEKCKEDIGQVLFKFLSDDKISVNEKIEISEKFRKVFEGEEEKKNEKLKSIKNKLLKEIKTAKKRKNLDFPVEFFSVAIETACRSESQKVIESIKEETGQILFKFLSKEEIPANEKLQIVKLFNEIFEKKEKKEFRIKE